MGNGDQEDHQGQLEQKRAFTGKDNGSKDITNKASPMAMTGMSVRVAPRAMARAMSRARTKWRTLREIILRSRNPRAGLIINNGSI